LVDGSPGAHWYGEFKKNPPKVTLEAEVHVASD